MPFQPLGVEVVDAEPIRHRDYQGARDRSYGADSRTGRFIGWDGEGIAMPATPIRHTSGLWIRDDSLHESDGSLITYTPNPQP